jgi:hypothetical protein
MAVGLIVVLLALVAAIAFVIQSQLGNNGNAAPATETALALANAAPATTAPATTAPTIAITATTAATDTPVPATATVAPSATPSPSPTVGATATQPDANSAVATQTAMAANIDQQAASGAVNISNILDETPITGTPTMTITPNGTSTRPPTSTPVQDTPAPTATLTPTMTPTNPVRIPTRAATPKAITPASESVAANLPTTIVLLSPNDGDTIENKLSFSWQISTPLPAGYQFEPIFWREGQDPMQDGKGYGGVTTEMNLSVSADVFRETGEGKYYWGVRLTEIPYKPLQYLGGGRVIHVKLSSPSNDNDSKPHCDPNKQTC